MIMYGWGNLSDVPDTAEAAKLKITFPDLIYPNLFSLHGKHLLGTEQDWLYAFWGGSQKGEDVMLVEIPDSFLQPITLLRDMRGVMNYYLQTHTLDCGKPSCWNCNHFLRKNR